MIIKNMWGYLIPLGPVEHEAREYELATYYVQNYGLAGVVVLNQTGVSRPIEDLTGPLVMEAIRRVLCESSAL